MRVGQAQPLRHALGGVPRLFGVCCLMPCVNRICVVRDCLGKRGQDRVQVWCVLLPISSSGACFVLVRKTRRSSEDTSLASVSVCVSLSLCVPPSLCVPLWRSVRGGRGRDSGEYPLSRPRWTCMVGVLESKGNISRKSTSSLPLRGIPRCTEPSIMWRIILLRSRHSTP